MDPLDEALRRTAAGAERYRVPDYMTDLAAWSLTQIPDQARADSGMRTLLEAVWLIADSHQPCAGRCATCDAIRNGLAVALGVIRAEVDMDFGRRLP